MIDKGDCTSSLALAVFYCDIRRTQSKIRKLWSPYQMKTFKPRGLIERLIIIIILSGLKCKYSRTPLTRTLKGNENLFELAGFRVIGVD